MNLIAAALVSVSIRGLFAPAFPRASQQLCHHRFIQVVIEIDKRIRRPELTGAGNSSLVTSCPGVFPAESREPGTAAPARGLFAPRRTVLRFRSLLLWNPSNWISIVGQFSSACRIPLTAVRSSVPACLSLLQFAPSLFAKGLKMLGDKKVDLRGIHTPLLFST